MLWHFTNTSTYRTSQVT